MLKKARMMVKLSLEEAPEEEQKDKVPKFL